MSTENSSSRLSGLIRFFTQSKITLLLVISSILLGLYALVKLPREEEPQIIVPMFDVFVSFPGASVQEVEKRVIDLGERKLWEIPGVEYIYSMAEPHQALFIVRFKVGEDYEKSLIKLYTKVYANLDVLPAGLQPPLIKQRSIDDVPFLALTFHGGQRSPMELRQMAASLRTEIQATPNTSEVTLIGGRKRQFQVFFNENKLREHLMNPTEIARVIRDANRRLSAGHVESTPLLTQVEPSGFILTKEDLGHLVVGVSQGRPIQLKDVARVMDGPDEEEREVRIHLPSSDKTSMETMSAVTLAVAKRQGANATELSREILKKVEGFRGTLIPKDVQMTVTRNYGQTAAEKSNELLWHMGLAIVGVTLLIGFALGFRAAGIVSVAIPVTLSLTLLTFYFLGYTLNRITLFALIFTIGVLVDDPIVVVENVIRHLSLVGSKTQSLLEKTVSSVLEIVSPLFLATLAVIAAILPMAGVGGLMGPYMRPIPIGASAAMIFSMLVSLTVTPWAAARFLKKFKSHHQQQDDLDSLKEHWMTRSYIQLVQPLIRQEKKRKIFLIVMVGLFLASLLLFPFKAVKMKMLPFDNKDEFQVILNMPEGTPVEKTKEVLDLMTMTLFKQSEVRNIESYVGASAPYNFNGLVRHYFLRDRPHQGDLQVNLAPKHERKRQSHAIAESARSGLQEIARQYGAHVQLAEIPPGPPVLSTLVIEIYGPQQSERRRMAQEVEHILHTTHGITDVATYEESDQPLLRYFVDHQKTSLNGISVQQLADTMSLALKGQSVDMAHLPAENEPVDIVLRLPKEQRQSVEALLNLPLLSRYGQSIPVGQFLQPTSQNVNRTVHHKNLQRVSYVLADVTDALGSPIYAMAELQKKVAQIRGADGKPVEMFFIHQPSHGEVSGIKWDGEWHISYEVFRDLGISFGAVLILIFILLVGWFQSFKVPLIVMLPIPLSMVGIIPAHWMTGTFFSATSMIGLIAGAGIVVRNAIILVDFIQLRMAEGHSIENAVVEAGAVRFRPMLLTAAAVVIGASVLLVDPIFKGLALSLIAGEIASTLLSRTAVPVLYYMIMRHETLTQNKNHESTP